MLYLLFLIASLLLYTYTVFKDISLNIRKVCYILAEFATVYVCENLTFVGNILPANI